MVVSSPQHGENTAFSPVFPLADFMAETFYWLFPWNVIEKSINRFLGHSQIKQSHTVTEPLFKTIKNNFLRLKIVKNFNILYMIDDMA
ncbi:hypothetical protein [Bilophila sp.]|uniref:hypothetical protein n=1 Tax=Bilophila sp. TaxID=1929485 RepID=UPI003078951C